MEVAPSPIRIGEQSARTTLSTTVVVPSLGGGPLFQVLPPEFADIRADPLRSVFTQGAAISSVVEGDVRTALQLMPAASFRACVTSPPYWSLRDYGIPGQIGLEDSVFSYIDNLVSVFEQVRRVLAEDGTLWLNIGDSYTSGGRTWRAPDRKNPVRAMDIRPATPHGLKPKDLVGVPWRLALALQSAGWYLRADIIWNKPNCQPESVKDRPTRCHEYLFLFSKPDFPHQ